jgi:hypothetical protein
MAVTSNDINMVLSGGTSNIDSNESLGGEPSSQPINSETLFSNISKEDANAGYTDYRCIYIFNESGIDDLKKTGVQITAKEEAGASVTLGINYKTDIQEMTIRGEVTGGNFTISCPGTHPSGPLFLIQTIQYDADIDIWAINLQTALRSCTAYGYNTIEVTGVSTSNSYIFTINFVGNGDNRFYDLIDIQDNNLTGSSPSITIRKKQNGSPINAIAPLVPSMEAAPSGVQFTSTTGESVPIGRLFPDDGFPLWVKRVVTEGSDSVAGDGFTMRLTGS